MKMTLADWPVLIVSGEFSAGNNEGHRLRELLKELKKVAACTVISATSYEDALEMIASADVDIIDICVPTPYHCQYISLLSTNRK